jgi:uncharacterized membrane protein
MPILTPQRASSLLETTRTDSSDGTTAPGSTATTAAATESAHRTQQTELAPPRPPRHAAVDVLRGIVMIVMALDHVRDFFSGATFDPTDLERTTPAYFFTRWVTHFCAPTFIFLAGVSAFLSSSRRTRRQLTTFLLSRGLWLVIVELTIVRVAWSFDISSPLRLLVIWALGVSMIVLAGLIHMPRWAIAAVGVAMIAGHDLLNSVDSAPLIDAHRASLHASLFDWIWAILHVPYFPVLYPLIPWIGVMAAGYAFGPLLTKPETVRTRQLTWLGIAISTGFVALRVINVYGDPFPLESSHPFLSILNTNKYPPSLLFLMMTLGPAIAALPWLERLAPTPVGRIVTVFGRVPFFYYIVHLYLIHTLSALTSLLMGTSRFDLWVVYLVWALVVALLYPACRWFAGLKARRRSAWLSYL